MTRDEFFLRWSKEHGGASIRGIVRGWLVISFAITRPLVALKVSPNFLSILSIFTGLGFVLTTESFWALIFLAVSLLLDGIDGTVAISGGKSSKLGALVDSISDRIVESCWAFGSIS